MEQGTRFDPRISTSTQSINNVGVRSVTHFPITFTPKVTASV